MFLRNDLGAELAGGTTTRPFDRAPVMLARKVPPLGRLRARAQRVDWVPDLGVDIGSPTWWRGLATCTALCAATWALSPGLHRPLTGAVPAPLAGTEREEARAQTIAPLALGADTGRRMAANDLVLPLADAPERPVVELAATLGEGDSFTRLLERAGVGEHDAEDAAALVSQRTALGEIAPGTRIAVTLGRRASKMVPRPLDRLALRARFDLNLTLTRSANGLVATPQPIAVDHTPLRLQGQVGAGLYRAARTAGAPASVAEDLVKALAMRVPIATIGAADRFDMVIDRERAATGETRLGALRFAGLDQRHRRTQLVRWTADGEESWWGADGRTRRDGFFEMPVAGHVTSPFGWRVHPILGFMRFHKGVDIGAHYGTPIRAASDGAVTFAGRSGGYGNFVRLRHAGSIESGYGHMSRIAVRVGEHVARGEVIGYVGSTGLATGPHLHWEVWRDGVAVDPRRISYSSVAMLSGEALRAFRRRVAELTAVRIGG